MILAHSINELSEEVIFERKINADNLKTIVEASMYNHMNTYGIEFKPKSFNDGIFATVVYEESDNTLYLLETPVSSSYKDALNRLKSSKMNGFVVKLIPIKYHVYGILQDGNVEILETDLIRSDALKKIQTLNQTTNSEYSEFDCNIEDGNLLKSNSCFQKEENTYYLVHHFGGESREFNTFEKAKIDAGDLFQIETIYKTKQ